MGLFSNIILTIFTFFIHWTICGLSSCVGRPLTRWSVSSWERYGYGWRRTALFGEAWRSASSGNHSADKIMTMRMKAHSAVIFCVFVRTRDSQEYIYSEELLRNSKIEFRVVSYCPSHSRSKQYKRQRDGKIPGLNFALHNIKAWPTSQINNVPITIWTKILHPKVQKA